MRGKARKASTGENNGKVDCSSKNEQSGGRGHLNLNQPQPEKPAKGINKQNIKSPSDTTIYAPALQLTPTNRIVNIPFASPALGPSNCCLPVNGDGDNTIDNLVSTFVENIRVQHEEERRPSVRSQVVVPLVPEQTRQQQQYEQQQPEAGPSNRQLLEEANNYAEDMVVRAEQARAAVELPKGEFSWKQNVQFRSPQGLSDDEFFHLTCHVDSALKQKIERGEYVELDKLLSKERFRGGQRMELVTKGGETFIMPAEKENKITNIRKWEQAFRIYAAIYSSANPHRSADIWQYMFVINSAATAYAWDNVATYDSTFRQLMACNPSRSWANIYLQMWNLTMRDLLPKNNPGTSHHGAQNHGNHGHGGSSHHNGHKRKPKHCWAFNKGLKCKFAPNCRFIENALTASREVMG